MFRRCRRWRRAFGTSWSARRPMPRYTERRISNRKLPTMAKAKTAYVCSECGADHNKWQGQCGECGAWNTLSEFVVEPAGTARVAIKNVGYSGRVDAAAITPLKQVSQVAEV